MFKEPDISLTSWWRPKTELKWRVNIGLAFVRWPETDPHSVFFCVFRALIWQSRSVQWPTQSAPQSIQRTASVMFSMSPPCHLCPASIGLSSNVLAHVAASSGSPSSRPGLRFMSTHLPLERTGPKAACSCRTRVYQQPDRCVLMYMNLIYWWILVRSLHCIKDNLMKIMKKNECYSVEFFEKLFVHL